MFFLAKFEVATLVKKKSLCLPPSYMRVLAVLCALETQKATLIWERRIPLVPAILEVFVLFIRPGEGNTKDTVSQIICLGKRETERNTGGREVSLAQTLRGACAAAPAPSASSPENTKQCCFKLPTTLSPFPHPGECNNGIMQVPALGKKLLRRNLTAAFLA